MNDFISYSLAVFAGLLLGQYFNFHRVLYRQAMEVLEKVMATRRAEKALRGGGQ